MITTLCKKENKNASIGIRTHDHPSEIRGSATLATTNFRLLSSFVEGDNCPNFFRSLISDFQLVLRHSWLKIGTLCLSERERERESGREVVESSA